MDLDLHIAFQDEYVYSVFLKALNHSIGVGQRLKGNIGGSLTASSSSNSNNFSFIGYLQLPLAEYQARSRQVQTCQICQY